MRINVEELLERLDFPALLAEDGHELKRSGANLVCRCMFHEERSGSFTVRNRRTYKCFGCGENGNGLTYIQKTRGYSSFLDAIRDAERRAGMSPIGYTPKQPRDNFIPRSEEPDRSQWPDLRRGTLAEMQAVADLRGIDVAACRVADSVDWLLFGTFRLSPCWFICDSARNAAQARRMDGKPFVKEDKELKAWTLYGSRLCPVGLAEAAHYPAVLLVEGGPDFLAALHFMHARRDWVSWCPVAFLGAANGFTVEALETLRGKRVRIFPHLDPAGVRAANRWTEQLTGAGCVVDAFSFDGLRRDDGEPVEDLNDAARIHADDAAELLEVLP